MDLSDFKTYSEILKNLITSSGIIIGGIWTYYKFFKGRIHTPKIESQLNSMLIINGSDKHLLCSNVLIKNLGSTIILPEKVEIKIEGVKTNEKEAIRSIIKSDLDILNYYNESESINGQFYIDPYEFSSRYFDCIIETGFRAILVTVTIDYNKKRRTRRTFIIENKLTTTPNNYRSAGCPDPI